MRSPAEDRAYPPRTRRRRARTADMPGHRATMAQAAGIYPFMAEAGLDLLDAPKVGDDVYGGSFHFSAYEAYLKGVISSPNVAVLGALGQGKSSLMKSVFLDRETVWGRRGFAVDVKREYLPLAAEHGIRPVTLAPDGGGVTINPLAPSVSADEREMLACAICAAVHGRDLLVHERNTITWALRLMAGRQRADGVLTLPRLRDVLFGPQNGRAASADAAALWDELVAARQTTSLRLRRESRELAEALEHLCAASETKGMFDGPTSEDLDLGGRLVVLDISELENASPYLLAIAMAIAMTWLRATAGSHLASAGQATECRLRRWTFILDEAWHALTVPQVAAFVRRAFKLSRSWGWQNVIVLHRLSDLLGVADAGTKHAEIVRGLLSDTQVRVIYRQPPEQVMVLADEFGLSDTERRLIPTLTQGRALWVVAQRSFLVDHRLGPDELQIVDTDAAMRTQAERRGLAA